MAALQWDTVGTREFTTGVDRVTLYLDDGLVVPWSGVTEITKDSNLSTEPVYFDGKKINEIVRVDNFSGKIKALTYPDEFIDYEGYVTDESGLIFAEQKPRRFNMAYRSLIGSDTEGLDAGYRIHVLYDLTALPADRTYQTLSLDVEPLEFEWDLKGIPKHVPGARPTSHVIVDSRKVSPIALLDLEEILFGSEEVDPFLPSLESFSSFVRNYDRIVVFDNGDGTWTISTDREGVLTINGDGTFTIDADVVNLLNADEFEVSSSEKEDLWQP